MTDDDQTTVTRFDADAETEQAIARMDEQASKQMMDLLAAGVPLALLADLGMRRGPSSAEILEQEGLPADEWWQAEHRTA